MEAKAEANNSRLLCLTILTWIVVKSYGMHNRLSRSVERTLLRLQATGSH